MFVERPDERQWNELVHNFGVPQFEDRIWSIPEVAGQNVAPSCAGAVILLIFNMASSCVFVRRNGSSDWFLPMGRIETGESIVGAARRKAMEEAGIAIELIGVPLCQRVTISYSDQTFNRWHLIVVAETASSVLDPKDRSEIAQAGLFDISPSHANTYLASWMNELHVAAMRFMRSLDVMDGI